MAEDVEKSKSGLEGEPCGQGLELDLIRTL